jgi:hypothetical protein
VVSVHYQLAHGTFSGTGYKMIEVEGMEFKVLMGTDPSEVEEWRNQRRKKFPSKANIDQKERDRQELKTAGGIEREAAKQPKRRSDAKKRSREEPGAQAEEMKDLKKLRETATVPPADQTTSGNITSLVLVQDYGSSESGEEREEIRETDANQSDIVRKPVACRLHLAGKCRKGEKCRYSHDSVAGDSANVPQPCSYFLKGKCRKGGRCPFVHNSSSQDSPKEAEKVVPMTPLSLPPPSLYRKLVASEVHNEENVILQCIRFFARENFFES